MTAKLIDRLAAAISIVAIGACSGFRNECFDGIDNDEDGLIDAADPGCDDINNPQVEQRRKLQEEACGTGTTTVGLPVKNPACQRVNVGSRESDDPQCFDREDNDGDGAIDWPNDLGCVDIYDDDEENPQCSDGKDNDGDGLIDFHQDPGCFGDPSGTTEAADPACADGKDNDGDGLIDFPNDFGCNGPNDISELGNECSDTIDNDGDGAIDYPEDPECTSPQQDREAAFQCGDEVDNDFDGYTDFPADLGCTSRFDDSEWDNPACSDGRDNDLDGRIDYPADPGCVHPRDTSEFEPACQDGIDNDGDALIDYPADTGCVDLEDNDERTPECVDGIDNDADGYIDYPEDPGCDNFADETEDRYACSDGLDNDGDNLIDFPADPGCTPQDLDGDGIFETSASRDDTESDFGGNCDDGIDNDGDGLTDKTTPRNLGDPACDAGMEREDLDPVCADRFDNDGDGRADFEGVDINGDGFFDGPGEFPPDPACFSPLHHDESLKPECGDGIDNDGDGEYDWNGVDTSGDGQIDTPWDRGCVDPITGNPSMFDRSESDPSQCEDGFDNDGNGLLDYEPQFFIDGSPNPAFLLGDPGCDSIFDNSESL